MEDDISIVRNSFFERGEVGDGTGCKVNGQLSYPAGVGGGAVEYRHIPVFLNQQLQEIDSDKSCATCDKRRSEEHTSELQSRGHLVCRLLLEKKKKMTV